jgi:hypothetical protein
VSEFKPRPALSLVAGLGLVGALFGSNQLKEEPTNVYEADTPKEVLDSSAMKFEEVSEGLGLLFSHQYYPGPPIYLATMFPAVSIVDIDDDGFMDVYFSSGQGRNKPNFFYHNIKGKQFKDASRTLKVKWLNREWPSSFSVFADFNQDGLMDLLVAKWGCHQLFFGTGLPKPFVDVSEKLGGYCSNPNSVGVADLDKDGNLDLVFGNFLPDAEHVDHSWHMPTKGDRIHGGQEHILFGRSDGSFGDKYTFPENTYTHAVGLTDLNRDGFPDLLFATDWSYDDMYLNKGNRQFEEVTERYIPRDKAGNSSMNSEIFDYDQDEWPDIYITNAFKPPYIRAHNNMWKRKPGGGFEEQAMQNTAGRCGFSWGAKFADFDLDGQSDLMVVNGRLEGPHVKSLEGSYSFWYQRFLLHEVPVALRHTYVDEHVLKMPTNFYMSSFERSCLFEHRNGQFYDVARHAGIDDTYNGRGLALIDYDNDGRMDFVVANVGARALLYHNVSERKGEWVGFDLDGGHGKRIPFGARLEVGRPGKTHIVRELYPTNGMKSQSDPRFILGIPPGEALGKADVVWADGVRETFETYSKNQYNRLTRGQGKPAD